MAGGVSHPTRPARLEGVFPRVALPSAAAGKRVDQGVMMNEALNFEHSHVVVDDVR